MRVYFIVYPVVQFLLELILLMSVNIIITIIVNIIVIESMIHIIELTVGLKPTKILTRNGKLTNIKKCTVS